MKKVLLTLIVPLCGVGLLAQSTLHPSISKHPRKTEFSGLISKPTTTTSQAGSQQLRDVLWSDDFSNPSTWVFTNTSTTPYDWVITTDLNAMPNATDALFPFASATAENGYALANSDGSPFQSDGAGQVRAEIRTATPINLSDQENVWLTFQHNYRWWQDTRGVRLSGDNGVTWTDFEITGTVIPEAQNTPNPAFERINVSEIVAGQSQVLIEFYYDDNNFWGWYWVIDDVALETPLPNDLTLTEGYRNIWPLIFDEGVENAVAPVTVATFAAAVDDLEMVRGFEYGLIPSGQESMHVVAYITNNGLNTQTGVTVTAELTDPDGVTHSFASNGSVSIETEQSERINFEVDLSSVFPDGLPNGPYSVNYILSADEADENPLDNSLVGKVFTVNDDQMNHDTGPAAIGTWYAAPSNSIWANRMAFQETATVTHIQFAILPNRDLFPDTTAALDILVGELLFPNIREASVMKVAGPNNPAVAIYGANTLEYVVEQESITLDLSQPIFVNYQLPEPLEIDIEKIYHAEMSFGDIAQGAPEFMFMPAQSNSNSYASMIFDNAQASSYGQGWFNLGASPIIRFVVESTVSTSPFVAELDFKVGQNFPNPTSGVTTIEWELIKPAKNIRFTLTDLNGRTVYAKDLGDRPAGQQEPLMLDLGQFAAGNYQYGITIGNQRIVKKMVIVE